MRRELALLSAVIGLVPSALWAGIPTFNATCPGPVSIHADQGGPVYVDGKQAKLKKFNADYYEATSGHFVLSISITPDGSVMLSYTGKGGANGICNVDDGQGGGGGCPADVSEADRYMYPACN